METYIHIVEGRMRIRMMETKGDAIRSARVVQCLQQLQGVTQVRANPTTGSVLIHFEAALLQPHHIIQRLREHGYLTRADVALPQLPAFPSVSRRVVETLLHVAFEKTVRQVIVGLM
jgi:copper chaperone CopZ